MDERNAADTDTELETPLPSKQAPKDTGPTLEAVMAVADLREAEKAFHEADTRPRIMSVDSPELGEGLVFRRWSPEQVYTIRSRLLGIGHTTNAIDVIESNRGHAIKAIQIGLVDGSKLAHPGDDGFNTIGRLANAELSRLATDALKFNEVF